MPSPPMLGLRSGHGPGPPLVRTPQLSLMGEARAHAISAVRTKTRTCVGPPPVHICLYFPASQYELQTRDSIGIGASEFDGESQSTLARKGGKTSQREGENEEERAEGGTCKEQGMESAFPELQSQR